MRLSEERKTNRNKLIIISVLTFLIMFISLFIGRFNIPIMKFINGFNLNEMERSVFYFIRLPRILLVMGVGAALSIAGASYQSIFRNPLFSPDILGVSAGASFGAALGMILAFQSLTSIYILAFIFGVLAVFLTYFISASCKELLFPRPNKRLDYVFIIGWLVRSPLRPSKGKGVSLLFHLYYIGIPFSLIDDYIFVVQQILCLLS